MDGSPSNNVSSYHTSMSSICGTISIICWLMVSPPQIFKNYRRHSTEGYSIAFVTIWLLGDVCNVLGSILQDVLSTMLILAMYFAFIDTVLLLQVLYYRNFTVSTRIVESSQQSGHDSEEDESLLPCESQEDVATSEPAQSSEVRSQSPRLVQGPKLSSTMRVTILSIVPILVVCAFGVLAWWAFTHHSHDSRRTDGDPFDGQPEPVDDIQINVVGQVLGWLSTSLYICARIPQILANHRRQSTEAISALFFSFASIANITFLLSIFLYDGAGQSEAFARYLAINASWITSGVGSLLLDTTLLLQVFWYGRNCLDGHQK